VSQGAKLGAHSTDNAMTEAVGDSRDSADETHASIEATGLRSEWMKTVRGEGRELIGRVEIYVTSCSLNRGQVSYKYIHKCINNIHEC